MRDRSYTVCFLSLLVAACGEPKQGGPATRIVLAAEPVAHAAPVWVAESRGFFRDAALDVVVREFESGRTALRTMLEDSGIDMATAAQTPVVLNSFTRTDYAIVAGMVSSDRDLQLVARKDHGIGAVSDLRGRKVGLTVGSAGHFFLSLALSLNRLSILDVRLVDLEATRLVPALVDGNIDAIACWHPYVIQARQALDDRAVVLPTAGIFREDFYFIARREFIQARPAALARFLAAMERAEEFIAAHPAEAESIVVHRLGEDPVMLGAYWDQFNFRLFLDQSSLVALEDEARWAIANGLTDATRVPNYLGLIEPGPLSRVRPDAVNLPGWGRQP